MSRTVLPFVFVAVGLVLAGVAGYLVVDRQELADTGERVTGTVSSVRTSRDSEGDVTYAPVYTYSWREQLRQYSPDSTSSSRPTVGEEATLIIDPSDPDRIMADTFMGRWFVPVLLGGMGIVFFVIGAVIAAASIRGAIGGGAERLARRARSQPGLEQGPSTSMSMPTTSELPTGPFVDGGDHKGGPFL